VAQVVELLLNKNEALSSNPSTTKKGEGGSWHTCPEERPCVDTARNQRSAFQEENSNQELI
jgi:hypothetical protein